MFHAHDKDSSGTLSYDEFCNVFALLGSGTNPNINPVFKIQREPPKEVLDRIIAALK